VRRGGTEELLRRLDDMAAGRMEPFGRKYLETADGPASCAPAQREADRIIAVAVGMPTRPDTVSARGRRRASQSGRGTGHSAGLFCS